MQRGFTKLFSTIVTSTIWQEDNETRILWITMLALADRFGEVSASVPGLASIAKISQKGCRNSIKKLESPDPDSRTSTEDGRRIRKADGGWTIINYEKYRQLISQDERRQYKARWIKQKRKALSTLSTNEDKSRYNAEAEAEATEASAASVGGVQRGNSTQNPDLDKLRANAKEEFQKLKAKLRSS